MSEIEMNPLRSRLRKRIGRRDAWLAGLGNAVPAGGVLYLIGSTVWFDTPVRMFDVVLFLGCYFLAMVGLEIGFHRYFAHKSFKTSKAFELVLGVLGSMSFQGGIILWVATHRRHHGKTDTSLDPHSPIAPPGSGLHARLKQFSHAYIGWMFDPESLKPKGWERMAPDMFKDPSLFRLHVGYVRWGILGLAVPTLAGLLWYQSLDGALAGFLWGVSCGSS